MRLPHLLSSSSIWMILVLIVMLCTGNMMFVSAQEVPTITFTALGGSVKTLTSFTSPTISMLTTMLPEKNNHYLTIEFSQPFNEQTEIRFEMLYCDSWFIRKQTGIKTTAFQMNTSDKVFQLEFPCSGGFGPVTLYVGANIVGYYQGVTIYSQCLDNNTDTIPTSTCPPDQVCTPYYGCIYPSGPNTNVEARNDSGYVYYVKQRGFLPQRTSQMRLVLVDFSYGPTKAPLTSTTVQVSWLSLPHTVKIFEETIIKNDDDFFFLKKPPGITPGTYSLRIAWTDYYGLDLSSYGLYAGFTITILPSCFDNVRPLGALPAIQCDPNDGNKYCHLNNQCLECKPGYYKNDDDSDTCVQIVPSSLTVTHTTSPTDTDDEPTYTILRPDEETILPGGGDIIIDVEPLLEETSPDNLTMIHWNLSLQEDGGFISSGTIISDPRKGITSPAIILANFGPGDNDLKHQYRRFSLHVETTQANEQTISTEHQFVVIPSCMKDQETSKCGNHGVCNPVTQQCECDTHYIIENETCVLPLLHPTITATYTNHHITEPTLLPDDFGITTSLYTGSVITIKITQPEFDPIKNRVPSGEIVVAFGTDSFSGTLEPTSEFSVEITVSLDLTPQHKDVLLTVADTSSSESDFITKTYTLSTYSHCYAVDTESNQWVDTCGTHGTCNNITNQCDCDDTYVHDSNGKCIGLTLPSVVVTYKSDDGGNGEPIDIALISGPGSSTHIFEGEVVTFVFTPDSINPTDTNVSVVLSQTGNNGEGDDVDDKVIPAFEFDLSANDKATITKTYTLPLGRGAYQMKIIYTLYDTTHAIVYNLHMYPACWGVMDCSDNTNSSFGIGVGISDTNAVFYTLLCAVVILMIMV